MEYQEPDPSSALVLKKTANSYHLMDTQLSLAPSSWLEIRLFYVRISPCVVECVPDHLILRHPRRGMGVSLEINGSRVPASDAVSLTLRRDRLNREASEVTYVSTDAVRVTGGFEFEVYENEEMVLCGSLERMDGAWSNGTVTDARTGWDMDCYMSMGNNSGSVSGSAFFQRKLGVMSPSIEVYIAGCCGGGPVILTKTITTSPRKKGSRHLTLDAIPEDEEIGKDHKVAGGGGCCNGLVRQRKLQIMEAEVDDYESEQKIVNGYYAEDMYTGEDGQLSWFNAGVRVGVGIGLGMCLGIGIGVGLLMRSYQATTRNFRRRFL